MSEVKDCGCGRSPTGKCIGWHSLTEEEYSQELTAFREKEREKNLSDEQATSGLPNDDASS